MVLRRPSASIGTHPSTVSRWERGIETPHPEKPTALAKIASNARHEDLTARFRAPLSAWGLVGHMRLGLKDEEQERAVRNALLKIWALAARFALLDLAARRLRYFALFGCGRERNHRPAFLAAASTQSQSLFRPSSFTQS
jgi:hypothetical protein